MTGGSHLRLALAPQAWKRQSTRALLLTQARLVVCLMVCGVYSGCAFENIMVDLPQGVSNSRAVASGKYSLLLSPAEDRRIVPENRIGMVKNGYGMDTADVLPRQLPSVWLTDRLRSELEVAGFQIVTIETPGRTVLVKPTLTMLYAEPVLGWFKGAIEADIGLSLHVIGPGDLDATRNFYSKGTQETFLATREFYLSALKSATEDLMRKVVGALVILMEGRPETKKPN